MTTPVKPPEEWVPCPSGKLKLLAQGERRRQRRQFLIRATGVVGAAALVSGAVHQVIRSLGPVHDPVVAGIACSRVKSLAPKFVSGDLEDDLIRRIEAHVQRCPGCAAMIEAMRPKVSFQRPHKEAKGGCGCPCCRRAGLVAALAPAGEPTERKAWPRHSSV